MSEQVISAGVFVAENDASFLPQGIADIGAAFIGPLPQGPAFVPTIIQSPQEFQQIFGVADSNSYLPYCVSDYLKNAATATVVRVLGLSGYDSNIVKSQILSVSGSQGKFAVAVLHPSQLGGTITSASSAGTASSFSLSISSSLGTGTKTYTNLSADPTSTSYIGNIFGYDPTTQQGVYVYSNFARAFNSITNSGSAAIIIEPATGYLNFSGSIFGTYTSATTPIVQSQTIAGVKYSLFQFGTFADGNSANTSVKVSITNIKPSTVVGGFGTFTVLVRSYGDTDSKPQVLEQFENCTLDSTSVNYIAKLIGNTSISIDSNGIPFLDGDFMPASKYVYVILADGITSIPSVSLPYGFASLKSPIATSNVPAPSYILTSYTVPVGGTTAVRNSRTFYGLDFTDQTNISYLMPIPSGSVSANGDNGFNLESLASPDLSDISNALSQNAASQFRKFTIPFQGGFDGMNPARIIAMGVDITSTNTQGFDLSDSSKDGAKAYTMAINSVSNPDEYDINMLIMPGVIYSQHPYVATQGITLCETRQDCFYIMDVETLDATVDSVINAVEGIDSTYVGCYHPWMKVVDTNSGALVWVPPSVLMPGVYAFNDKVSAPWYAPAGLNRGGIGGAVQVRSRLSQLDRDSLYEANVNPIATFPSQGIVAWGQNTMEIINSPLASINVRRLLIAVKKYIASATRYLVFEPNDTTTWAKFLAMANPYLANVQQKQGLYAFKVVMDSSTVSNADIDNKIMRGALYLQPTRAAERIILSFNISASGAIFPTA